MGEKMIRDKIAEDLKAAMRARDKVRLRTLRSLRAALTDAEIAERKGGKAELTEQQELTVLQKQARQRRESIDQYVDAGRSDLADRERDELRVIEEYLPGRLSDEELREVLREIIEDVGATSSGDMGRVMGAAMQRLRGRADGSRVRKHVETLLAEKGG